MRKKIYNKETNKIEKNVKVIPTEQFFNKLINKLEKWENKKLNKDLYTKLLYFSNEYNGKSYSIPYIQKTIFSEIKKYYKDNKKKKTFINDFSDFISSLFYDKVLKEKVWYFPWYTPSYIIPRKEITKDEYNYVLDINYKRLKEKEVYSERRESIKQVTKAEKSFKLANKVIEVKAYKVRNKIFESYDKAKEYLNSLPKTENNIAYAYNFLNTNNNKDNSVYIQVYSGIDDNIKNLSHCHYKENDFKLYLNKKEIIKLTNLPKNITATKVNEAISLLENLIVYEKEYVDNNSLPTYKLALINYNFVLNKQKVIEIDYNLINVPVRLKKIIKDNF